MRQTPPPSPLPLDGQANLRKVPAVGADEELAAALDARRHRIHHGVALDQVRAQRHVGQNGDDERAAVGGPRRG